jgi:hypothetical protein
MGTDISPKHRGLGGTQAKSESVFILIRGLTDGLGRIARRPEKGVDLLPGNQDFSEGFAG